MFYDKYKLTSDGFLHTKFHDVATRSPWTEMSAGLYNHGVITVFDENYDESFLSSWEWLIGNNILLIGCTCWGDFIYVSLTDGEFYIVLVDSHQKFQMGNSFSAVFDMNIANEVFEDEILKLDLFQQYMDDIGELKYGEIYTYSYQKSAPVKRSISLFLDIAGQTGQQLK